MELPTTKVKASRKSPKNMIIYGAPKIGKTTVLSQLDNCLIIDLEDGSDMIDALKIKAKSLKELQAIGSAIMKDGRPYKYVGLNKSLDKFANTKVSVWDDLLGDSSEQNLKDAVLHRIWKEAKNGSIQHINLLASLGCLDAD